MEDKKIAFTITAEDKSSPAIKEIANSVAKLDEKLKQLNKTFSSFDTFGKKLTSSFDKFDNSIKKVSRDMTKSKETTKKMASDMNTLASSTKKATSAIFSLSNALKEIVHVTVAIYAIRRLSMMIKRFIDVGVEFEYAMKTAAAIANIKLVTPEGLRQYDEMIKKARELGSTTEWMAKDVAEGFKFLSMAGLNVQQSLKMIGPMLNLATAGFIDLGYAADISTNILTAFGKSVDELTYVSDVMVRAITTSNMTMEDLAEAMKYAAPVAHQFGYSIEETSALLAELSKQGIKGTIAGTGLRRSFVEVSKALEYMNVPLRDSEGGTKGLVETLELLKYRGIGAEEVMRLFGQRAGVVVNALMGDIDRLKETIKKYETTSAGTTARIANEMRNSVKIAFKEIHSVIQDLGIEAFVQFNNELKSGAKALSSWFRNNYDTLRTFFDSVGYSIKSILSILAPTLDAIADIAATTLKPINETILKPLADTLSKISAAYFKLKEVTSVGKGLSILTPAPSETSAMKAVREEFEKISNELNKSAVGSLFRFMVSPGAMDVSELIDLLSKRKKLNDLVDEYNKLKGSELEITRRIKEESESEYELISEGLEDLKNKSEEVRQSMEMMFNLRGNPMSAFERSIEASKNKISVLIKEIEDRIANLYKGGSGESILAKYLTQFGGMSEVKVGGMNIDNFWKAVIVKTLGPTSVAESVIKDDVSKYKDIFFDTVQTELYDYILKKYKDSGTKKSFQEWLSSPVEAFREKLYHDMIEPLKTEMGGLEIELRNKEIKNLFSNLLNKWKDDIKQAKTAEEFEKVRNKLEDNMRDLAEGITDYFIRKHPQARKNRDEIFKSIFLPERADMEDIIYRWFSEFRSIDVGKMINSFVSKTKLVEGRGGLTGFAKQILDAGAVYKKNIEDIKRMGLSYTDTEEKIRQLTLAYEEYIKVLRNELLKAEEESITKNIQKATSIDALSKIYTSFATKFSKMLESGAITKNIYNSLIESLRTAKEGRERGVLFEALGAFKKAYELPSDFPSIAKDIVELNNKYGKLVSEIEKSTIPASEKAELTSRAEEIRGGYLSTAVTDLGEALLDDWTRAFKKVKDPETLKKVEDSIYKTTFELLSILGSDLDKIDLGKIASEAFSKGISQRFTSLKEEASKRLKLGEELFPSDMDKYIQKAVSGYDDIIKKAKVLLLIDKKHTDEIKKFIDYLEREKGERSKIARSKYITDVINEYTNFVQLSQKSTDIASQLNSEIASNAKEVEKFTEKLKGLDDELEERHLPSLEELNDILDENTIKKYSEKWDDLIDSFKSSEGLEGLQKLYYQLDQIDKKVAEAKIKWGGLTASQRKKIGVNFDDLVSVAETQKNALAIEYVWKETWGDIAQNLQEQLTEAIYAFVDGSKPAIESFADMWKRTVSSMIAESISDYVKSIFYPSPGSIPRKEGESTQAYLSRIQSEVGIGSALQKAGLWTAQTFGTYKGEGERTDISSYSGFGAALGGKLSSMGGAFSKMGKFGTSMMLMNTFSGINQMSQGNWLSGMYDIGAGAAAFIPGVGPFISLGMSLFKPILESLFGGGKEKPHLRVGFRREPGANRPWFESARRGEGDFWTNEQNQQFRSMVDQFFTDKADILNESFEEIMNKHVDFSFDVNNVENVMQAYGEAIGTIVLNFADELFGPDSVFVGKTKDWFVQFQKTGEDWNDVILRWIDDMQQLPTSMAKLRDSMEMLSTGGVNYGVNEFLDSVRKMDGRIAQLNEQIANTNPEDLGTLYELEIQLYDALADRYEMEKKYINELRDKIHDAEQELVSFEYSTQSKIDKLAGTHEAFNIVWNNTLDLWTQFVNETDTQRKIELLDEVEQGLDESLSLILEISQENLERYRKELEALENLKNASADWGLRAAELGAGSGEQGYENLRQIYIGRAWSAFHEYQGIPESDVVARYGKLQEIANWVGKALDAALKRTAEHFDAIIRGIRKEINKLEKTKKYISDRIDELREERDEIKKNYTERIDGLKKELQLMEQWHTLLESIKQQMDEMNYSTSSQLDVFRRMEYVQRRIQEVQQQYESATGEARIRLGEELRNLYGVLTGIASGAYQDNLGIMNQYYSERMQDIRSRIEQTQGFYASATGEQKVKYGQELESLYKELLQMGQQAYQRPSEAYGKIFEEVYNGLEAIRKDAAEHAGDYEDTQNKIAKLTEEMNKKIKAIDDQIEPLQDRLDTINDKIADLNDDISDWEEKKQDALDDINSQAADIYTWLSTEAAGLWEKYHDAIEEAYNEAKELDTSFKNQAIKYYGIILREGTKLRKSSIDDMQDAFEKALGGETYRGYMELLANTTNHGFVDIYNALVAIGTGFGNTLQPAYYADSGMQSGGWVLAPAVKKLAEHEPELVIPKSKLTNILMSNGGSTQNLYLSVNVDASNTKLNEKELARQIIMVGKKALKNGEWRVEVQKAVRKQPGYGVI